MLLSKITRKRTTQSSALFEAHRKAWFGDFRIRIWRNLEIVELVAHNEIISVDFSLHPLKNVLYIATILLITMTSVPKNVGCRWPQTKEKFKSCTISQLLVIYILRVNTPSFFHIDYYSRFYWDWRKMLCHTKHHHLTQHFVTWY